MPAGSHSKNGRWQSGKRQAQKFPRIRELVLNCDIGFAIESGWLFSFLLWILFGFVLHERVFVFQEIQNQTRVLVGPGVSNEHCVFVVIETQSERQRVVVGIVLELLHIPLLQVLVSFDCGFLAFLFACAGNVFE